MKKQKNALQKLNLNKTLLKTLNASVIGAKKHWLPVPSKIANTKCKCGGSQTCGNTADPACYGQPTVNEISCNDYSANTWCY